MKSILILILSAARVIAVPAGLSININLPTSLLSSGSTNRYCIMPMGPCVESNRGDPDAECCHGLTCTKLNDWLHFCQPPREEISALHHGQCAKSDELCGFNDEPEKTCCDQDLKCQWIGKSLAKACQKPRDWVSKKGASKKDQCMEENEICGYSDQPEKECCDEELKCQFIGRSLLKRCQLPRDWTSKKTQKSPSKKDQCAKEYEVCGFLDEPEKECCDKELKCLWIGKSLMKGCQKPRDWVSAKDQCVEEYKICGYVDQPEKSCCDEELKCQYLGKSLIKTCHLPRDWVSKKNPSKKDQCAREDELCGFANEPEKSCCDQELKCQYIGRSLGKACQPPRDWAKDQCAREDELCGFADEPEKTCCNGELKCQYLGRSLLKKCQLPRDWVFKVQRQDL